MLKLLPVAALIIGLAIIIDCRPVSHEYNNQNIGALCPAYRIITAPDGQLSCKDLTPEEIKKGN